MPASATTTISVTWCRFPERVARALTTLLARTIAYTLNCETPD